MIQVFQPGRLTVGLMTPVDVSPDRMADVGEALELAALADQLGFAALWTRDVPLMVPQGSDNTASALEQKGVGPKPFVQSVQLELLDDADAAPEPLELGLRTGSRALIDYLRRLRAMGVAHVLFNLGHVDRGRPAREVIEELGAEVLPALVTGD